MKLFKTTDVNLLKDFIISKTTLRILTAALFIIDFSVNKPIYVNLLDMPELGALLALLFDFIIAIAPKITAKLLARKKYVLSVMAMFLGVGLIAFIYVGQYELTLETANDPLAAILNGGTVEPEAHSSRHILVTALTALLYLIATFVSFLYYSEYQHENPKSGFQYLQTDFLRHLTARLTSLQSRYERAFNLPTQLAVAVVQKQIKDCKELIAEHQQKLAREDTFYKYQLDQLALTEKQARAAIKLAYTRKSFFNRLFKS